MTGETSHEGISEALLELDIRASASFSAMRQAGRSNLLAILNRNKALHIENMARFGIRLEGEVTDEADKIIKSINDQALFVASNPAQFVIAKAFKAAELFHGVAEFHKDNVEWFESRIKV